MQNPALLLIGKTGAGKSSLANRLYNLATDDTTEVFKVSDDMKSETTDASTKAIMLEGITYDLIDMPGYMDTSGSDAQTVREIARIIMNCPYGIKAILFVTEYGRMTLEECNAVQWVKSHFGSDVISNVVVVISKVNRKQTLDRKLLEEALKIQSTDKYGNPLKELAQEVQGRWVISPNPDIFGSPDDVYWRREADLLIEYIQSFREPYTNDTFRRYRDTMENEESKNHRLDEEDNAKIQELEKEISRHQRLAREDISRRADHLEEARKCERRIANTMQEAEERKQKSNSYLKLYGIALGIVVVASAAIATLPTVTVAAAVGIITGLCLEMKVVEVIIMVAKLMPQYSEQILKVTKRFT